MGIGSIWHWLILALVIAILFGSKRIPELMADVAGGIRAFKRGLSEHPNPDTPEAADSSARPDAQTRGPTERTSTHG